MIYEETDLKFRIRSKMEELSLDDCDFTIAIKNRWGKILAEVKKDDCFQDSEGDWYFVLENPAKGRYSAFFKGEIYDEDYIKTYRTVTDMQHLVNIGYCDCDTCECECEEEHCVEYEQVWTADIDGNCYLVGSDGAFILTKDGKRIKFNR